MKQSNFPLTPVLILVLLLAGGVAGWLIVQRTDTQAAVVSNERLLRAVKALLPSAS